MRTAFLTLLLASSALCWAGDVIVSSPDGRLQVTVSDAGGRLYYSASFNDQKVLEPSALGLKTSIGDFTRDLTILDTKEQPVESHYTMRGTKASEADYKANQVVLNLQNKEQIRFSVVMQVSNHDIAFRYDIPRPKYQKKDMKRVRILSEASSFNLPEGTTTFISPQIGPETGWEQTKPSYEETYSADAPMDTPSHYGHGYIFPALFHLPGISGNPGDPGKSGKTGKPGNTWLLINETGVGSNFCGAHLSDYQAGNGYTIAYPDPGENNGFGSAFAAIPLPGQTPWRTVTIGSLSDIAETTISYDLVEPRYAPSTDYQPGRYTWSWLIWQDKSINYDDQVKFIDLASAMGFEYCLVDNWWDTQIGRDRIAELKKAGKDVAVVDLPVARKGNGKRGDGGTVDVFERNPGLHSFGVVDEFICGVIRAIDRRAFVYHACTVKRIIPIADSIAVAIYHSDKPAISIMDVFRENGTADLGLVYPFPPIIREVVRGGIP